MNRRSKLCRSKTQRGFTLVELMITVAIVAILATIAVVAFGGFLEQGKTSEAKTFLLLVKTKQETYRTRFGRYLTAPANPSQMPGVNQRKDWTPNQPSWRALGAEPKSGAVAYQYEVGSGSGACQPPGDMPFACGGIEENGTWFWAIARNGREFVLINSQRDAPWVIERE